MKNKDLQRVISKITDIVQDDNGVASVDVQFRDAEGKERHGMKALIRPDSYSKGMTPSEKAEYLKILDNPITVDADGVDVYFSSTDLNEQVRFLSKLLYRIVQQI